MKNHLLYLLFLPTLLLAHEGHPAPEGHGDLSHVILGLAIALPLAAAAVIGYRLMQKPAGSKRITTSTEKNTHG